MTIRMDFAGSEKSICRGSNFIVIVAGDDVYEPMCGERKYRKIFCFLLCPVSLPPAQTKTKPANRDKHQRRSDSHRNLWFLVPFLDYMISGTYVINNADKYMPYQIEKNGAAVAQLFMADRY